MKTESLKEYIDQVAMEVHEGSLTEHDALDRIADYCVGRAGDSKTSQFHFDSTTNHGGELPSLRTTQAPHARIDQLVISVESLKHATKAIVERLHKLETPEVTSGKSF